MDFRGPFFPKEGAANLWQKALSRAARGAAAMQNSEKAYGRYFLGAVIQDSA